jgi:hypothetical protein
VRGARAGFTTHLSRPRILHWGAECGPRTNAHKISIGPSFGRSDPIMLGLDRTSLCSTRGKCQDGIEKPFNSTSSARIPTLEPGPALWSMILMHTKVHCTLTKPLRFRDSTPIYHGPTLALFIDLDGGKWRAGPVAFTKQEQRSD